MIHRPVRSVQPDALYHKCGLREGGTAAYLEGLQEELADDARYTSKYKRLYELRKETIERVFADAKEKHGMRYTRYTGLAQVTNWVRLKCVVINLKKFVKRRWEDTHPSRLFLLFHCFYHFAY